MSTFAPHEVGFRHGETITTAPYPRNTSANQIVTDLVSALLLAYPEMSRVDSYQYGNRVWIARRKSDLSVSHWHWNTSHKRIHHTALGWYVDVHTSNVEKMKFVADLAEQLGINIEVKFEADIEPQLKLYESMFEKIAPYLANNSHVLVVCPTGSGKSHILQELGRTLRKENPGLDVHISTITEGVDVPSELKFDAVIANPDYSD